MKFRAFLPLLVLVSSVAMAEGKDDKFAEHKQFMLKEMDDQLTSLQTARACISSATTHEAVKACHEARERAHKQRREEKLNERIRELEAQKNKLKNEK